jgi:putative tryptophan/tyrosine transport system substrate-binding protein
MRRRDFIKAIAGSTAAWPITSRAQQSERVRRIGIVMGFTESDPAGQAQVNAFRQQLRKLGWIEGVNIHTDYRYPADDPSRIRAVAVELLGLAPDLIVSSTNLVTAILKSEVRTVPLVFLYVSDPIGSGFVTNLARPTGNVTGFANFEPSMGGKWLETLKEIAPHIERVGFILNPETPPNVGFFQTAEAAALSLKIKVSALGVHNRDEIEHSVTGFADEAMGGLIIAPHAITVTNSELIVALAARHRLPSIYPFAFYAKAGGLISYGFDPVDQFRQGAGYVDRILRGAQPSELPVQHPTKFELVINLTTAKTLGLTVPPSMQQLADEVIE